MIRIFLKIVADFRANPVAHGTILLLPAIQYGTNYFASVSALLFGLTVWNTRLRVTPLTTSVAVIAAAMSLLWAAIFLPDQPNLARELRFAFGLAIVLWSLDGAPRRDPYTLNGTWPLVVLALLALFALAQALAAKKGIALYAPKWLFINSDDYSLSDAWVEHAREHGYDFDVRPSAGFSEPSYLGGVSLFLHFVCLHMLRGRARIVASVLALAACAVSQTFYGLIANLIILFAFYHRHINKGAVFSFAMLGLLAVALPIFAAEPGRFERLFSGQDVSLGVRVFQPLELIGYVLSSDPFGVPLTSAAAYFQQLGLTGAFEDQPFQNGVLNLLFAYGWLGIPVLLLLLRSAGGGICALFVILLMAQNGAPLDFDKLVMVVFAVQVARHVRAHTEPHVLTHIGLRARPLSVFQS